MDIEQLTTIIGGYTYCLEKTNKGRFWVVRSDNKVVAKSSNARLALELAQKHERLTHLPFVNKAGLSSRAIKALAKDFDIE